MVCSVGWVNFFRQSCRLDIRCIITEPVKTKLVTIKLLEISCQTYSKIWKDRVTLVSFEFSVIMGQLKLMVHELSTTTWWLQWWPFSSLWYYNWPNCINHPEVQSFDGQQHHWELLMIFSVTIWTLDPQGLLFNDHYH